MYEKNNTTVFDEKYFELVIGRHVISHDQTFFVKTRKVIFFDLDHFQYVFLLKINGEGVEVSENRMQNVDQRLYDVSHAG